MQNVDKIGVIGVGSMGEAIVSGVSGNLVESDRVRVYDRDEARQCDVVNKHSVSGLSGPEELVQTTDLIVLAVKPDQVGSVLEQVDVGDKTLVSVAAGVKISTLKGFLDRETRVVRVMPNTPAQAGAGMSFVAPDPAGIEDSSLSVVLDVFRCLGRVCVVEEDKMDAVTALSGSGPAYVFYFLEALSEAGVYLGLDPEKAAIAAEQTLVGAGQLAVESDNNFYQLRSDVSSPGGTTVEALKHLEEEGVKGHIIEALRKAADKSRELSED